MKIFVLLAYWEDGDSWAHNDTLVAMSTDMSVLIEYAKKENPQAVIRQVTEVPNPEHERWGEGAKEVSAYDFLVLETETGKSCLFYTSGETCKT